MWLPKARRVDLGANVAGGPYDDTRKPKVCWHRTQGATLAGARSAFAAYPPHIGYDASTRELEQYISLLRHSYAFFNSEADDEFIIQIELVGFSEQSQDMPDWQIQNIVDDLVDPLEELIGVPPVVIWHGFRGDGEGIVLARADSPIRISLAELREFSGHLGHQHIPGDGHWDPGRFRIDEVLRRSQRPVPGGPSSEEEIDLSAFNGYALEVQDGELTQQRDGYVVAKGSAWLYDANQDALRYYPTESLRTACKNAGVLHIGVHAEHVKNLLREIDARNAARKAA